MIPMSLQTISKITNGKIYGNKFEIINQISINTKKIFPGCLFIAIIGNKFDAHNFVQEAILNGCGALLVEKKLPFVISQIVVNKTDIALGQIASWIRKKVSAKIIALTGSSGKTSVKEMTTAIFKQYGETLSTYKNLNNKIGVPLTLLQLTPKHRYAIIEIGGNKPGEISYISNLTNPDVVLINNIYHAHLKGFKNLIGVSKAKQEIFCGLKINGTAVINEDSNHWSSWKKHLKNKKIIKFSIKKNSNFFAKNIIFTTKGTSFTMYTPKEKIVITIPFLGYHNVANALAASSLARSLHVPLNIIQTGLLKTKKPSGRLEIIKLNEQQLLIDDTYNANVASMIAAIKILEKMPGYKILVVGDMAELGKKSILYHKTIGNAVQTTDINETFSIGNFSKEISKKTRNGKHFINKKSLCNKLFKILSKKKKITILIKGSRNSAMDEITKKILQEKKNVSLVG